MQFKPSLNYSSNNLNKVKIQILTHKRIGLCLINSYHELGSSRSMEKGEKNGNFFFLVVKIRVKSTGVEKEKKR